MASHPAAPAVMGARSLEFTTRGPRLTRWVSLLRKDGGMFLSDTLMQRAV